MKELQYPQCLAVHYGAQSAVWDLFCCLEWHYIGGRGIFIARCLFSCIILLHVILLQAVCRLLAWQNITVVEFFSEFADTVSPFLYV